MGTGRCAATTLTLTGPTGAPVKVKFAYHKVFARRGPNDWVRVRHVRELKKIHQQGAGAAGGVTQVRTVAADQKYYKPKRSWDESMQEHDYTGYTYPNLPKRDRRPWALTPRVAAAFHDPSRKAIFWSLKSSALRFTTPKETVEHVRSEALSPDRRDRIRAAQSLSLPASTVAMLMLDEDPEVAAHVASRLDLTDAVIEDGLTGAWSNEGRDMVADKLCLNRRLPQDLLDRVVTKLGSRTPLAVLDQPDLSTATIERLGKALAEKWPRSTGVPGIDAPTYEPLRKILQHPNAPASLSQGWSDSESPVLRAIALQQAVAPDPEYLHAAVCDPHPLLREAAASRSELTAPDLALLLTDTCHEVKVVLAKHDGLTADQVDYLFTEAWGGYPTQRDTSEQVLLGLASHPDLHQSALVKMSTIGKARECLRVAVASRPDLTPQLVQKLASDRQEEVRIALIKGASPIDDAVAVGLMTATTYTATAAAYAQYRELTPTTAAAIRKGRSWLDDDIAKGVPPTEEGLGLLQDHGSAGAVELFHTRKDVPPTVLVASECRHDHLLLHLVVWADGKLTKSQISRAMEMGAGWSGTVDDLASTVHSVAGIRD